MSTRSRLFPGAGPGSPNANRSHHGARLQRCLLAAAVAATALMSAAAVQADTVARSATVAPAAARPAPTATKATADVSVAINGPGALYVSRDTTALHFWIVDSAANTITRRASLNFDPGIDQIVAIELGDSVTGVLFADNLRVSGDQFRLAFRGEIADGGIAMPLKAGALAPLAAITVPDEVVAVDASQTDLVALIDAQNAIFARVNDVVQMQSDQIELFRLEAQNELVDFYETQVHEGPNGQALLDETAAGIQAQHDAFLAQVNADLGELQGKAAQITLAGAEQTARYQGPVLQCINGQVAKISERLNALDLRISALPDETDSDRLEAEIAGAEAEFARNETSLLACIDTLGFENYAPTVNVNEDGAGYQPIANAAQALLDDIEPRVEAWRLALEAAGMDKGARIENTAIATNAATFETYFNDWVSPTYTSEDPIGVPSLPGSRTKRLQEIADAKTAAEDAGAAKADGAGTKGGEVLCDAETWNFEFNIGAASVVIGTPWDDNIVTGGNINLVFALRGDDCIESHAGYDLVVAGPGADRVFAGDDHDIVLGGRDNDEIHGGAGNSYTVTAGPVVLEFDLGNLLIGQAGDDTIFGGEVAADRGDDGNVDDNGYTDFVFGDALLFGHPAGNDVIDGEMGIDFLFGQQGNDQIMNVVPGVFGIEGIDVPFGTFFFGGIGNDTIVGSNTTIAGVFPLLGDFIFGNDGNDIVSANDGVDFVFGANGDDRIDAGRDMDFAFGSDGNDSVVGNDGMDLVTGNAGNDTVRGSAGLVDLVFGGAGNDTLFGDDGMDLVFGRDGADRISGGNGIDLIFGASEADVIDGNDGVDLVFGGPAEDVINGNDGIDLLFGNAESDTIRGGNATDIVFGNDNTQKKDEFLFGDAGIDLVFGNAGNDVIEGGADIDLLFGNRGDDRISGNDGVDIAFGNDGLDTINGGNGFDILFGGPGWDVIRGEADPDLVFGGDGCDAIDGGDGTDLLFGNEYMDLVVGGNGLDLVFGGAGLDHIQGGADSDFLFGGDDSDYIAGDGSLDVAFGGSGNDHLLGGTGLDIVFGGDGNDYSRGDADADFLFGGNNDDTLDGADGSDFVFAGSGNDRLNSGNGTDFTFGNSGNDRLRAVEGRNFAFGNADDDTVDGYATSSDTRDYLFGNGGSDSITGNQSDTKDLRFGGAGSDSLSWNSTFVSASEFSVSWGGSATCQ
ncbi:MAG TPA: calcium-binding protein [Tahibacter sp.]|uniref:calcium-binding protein n=1 Tax=Tahibacter sp. TaxID=2056211 RepID=UPI002C55486C|nr:calcium-binding protein [Tahibacter sp.]HSX60848.1 calcium-binding protein [Tahibacter sp.]